MATNQLRDLAGRFLLLLLLALTQPLTTQSRGLKATTGTGKSFILEQLEGSEKGQTVKGLHEVKQYLENFGYLNYETSRRFVNDNEFDDLLESAIKTYQSFYHLNVTGNLDSKTVEMMMIPRCGVPDIFNGSSSMHGHHHNHSKHFHTVSRYVFLQGNPKWPAWKTKFTYTFQSSATPVVNLRVQRRACAQAFKTWAAVTKFTFKEVPRGAPADIVIGFHRRAHGDNGPFDGRGGVLAHAAAPPVGKLHIDADEDWSTQPSMQQADLESVVVHELGHVLGLGHTPVPQAIMYANYWFGSVKRNLHQDDIEGIRALYS
ncbi:metalloendoproteinase 2-MMP-like [Malania oleifera]|uniref:metalloendoproteinase 2-MMP-like n=1 Tax=Malania oleifera TaxID=397392 RepID=UPI0025AE1426|nr:metalloendoproteinase 2-MMP-like [Malania oleifera]